MPYHKSSNAIFLALALPLAVAACGGTVGQPGGGAGGMGTGSTGSSTTSMATGGTAGTMATAQSYCEGKIAREQKCDPATAGTVDACLANPDTNCLFSGIRPEVRDAIVACVNERPCGTGDDACYYDPGLANPVAGQSEFLAACQGMLATCTSIKDDYCSITIVSADTYTTLNACLQKPCAEINPCLQAAVDAICPGA